MHSEILDQLFSTWLEQPVKTSWQGGPADLLRGRFEHARIELGGVATAWLPLEGVVVSASRFEISPGLPVRIRVSEPSLQAVVAQRDVERWIRRFQLPFELELSEEGLLARARIAGFPVAEVEATLAVVKGWFVLQPRRASLLGVPNYAAWLFRTYLPLPPLAEGATLEEIGHEHGRLRLRFELDSFEEEITPGLFRRLYRRVLP